MSEPSVSSSELLNDPVYIEVVKQLRPHAAKDANISPQAIILSDLGMDSLAIMDFVFDLEDALDLTIPEHRIAEVKSIADLVAAVYLLQKEA
ncbi:MAG: phosphopantetheine-binding protein [Robiginitomaculum sp.]|nr:phosphopantetheine-binding protein [Robiginitomaculum sp.]